MLSPEAYAIFIMSNNYFKDITAFCFLSKVIEIYGSWDIFKSFCKKYLIEKECSF